MKFRLFWIFENGEFYLYKVFAKCEGYCMGVG